MKSTVWTSFKATNCWQAAFVRPFEDKANWKKHMAIWLSYAFGLLFVVSPLSMLIDDALSWPVPLAQMQKASGTLTRVVISRRGPSYLVITSFDGNEKRFFAPSLRRSDLRGLVGRRVTVWSQPGFELFYGRIQEAREIRVDSSDKYVIKYRERMPGAIEFDKKNHYWYLAMLALGLFLMVRPVWKHRKPIVETQQTIKRGE